MNIVCAECGKEKCNKPSGWHIDYWVRTRTPETLAFTTNNEPSLFDAALQDEEMLLALCNELGWQGGTIHQVKDEILKRILK